MASKIVKLNYEKDENEQVSEKKDDSILPEFTGKEEFFNIANRLSSTIDQVLTILKQ